MQIQGASVFLETVEGELPTDIALIPKQNVQFRDGRRPLRIPDADLMVSRSLDQAPGNSRTLAIDLDHGIDLVAKGHRGEACGWITSLTVGDEFIFAAVEWNELGKHVLGDRRYRFISPTYDFNKETGEIVALVRAGLTNDPAIGELPQVAAKQGDSMNPEQVKALRESLGLGAEATDEEILAAVAKETAARKVAEEAVATAQASAAAVAEGDKETVSKELFQETVKELAALRNQDTERQIAAATKEGRLAPAMADMARSLASRDQEMFDQFMDALPAGGLGKREPTPDDGQGDKPSVELTELERGIAASQGLTADQAKQAKADAILRGTWL